MHEIELMPLDELLPNPLNPKAHDEELLQKSIVSFGYVEPIVMDERTGLIVSGHGRKEILEQLFLDGQDAPEGVVVENGKWLIPVVRGWASRDDVEAKAVLVALNRTTERGGWDNENLLLILQELAEHDTLSLSGYAEADIAILEKLNEAQGLWTSDLDTAIDEFLDDNQIDRDKIAFQYSSVLRVYFQTEEAREDFYSMIGYEHDANAKTLRFPKSFQKGAAPEWTG